MAYCPECGGAVVDGAAYVCYRCGSTLQTLPEFVDGATEELFLEVIECLLDREIAKATSELAVDVPDADGEPSYRLDRLTDRIATHTIGYGKGFIESTLIGLEAANEDVEYDPEIYQSFFDWVAETVEQREAYIRAAIRDVPGGE